MKTTKEEKLELKRENSLWKLVNGGGNYYRGAFSVSLGKEGYLNGRRLDSILKSISERRNLKFYQIKGRDSGEGVLFVSGLLNEKDNKFVVAIPTRELGIERHINNSVTGYSQYSEFSSSNKIYPSYFSVASISNFELRIFVGDFYDLYEG